MIAILVPILVILIFGSGFLSASETALFSLSSMRVKAYKSGKDPRGKQIAKLLGQPRKLLVSILMLNVLMNILVQNVVASIFGSSSSWVLNVGVPLALTLIFGELIPKALAFANNAWISYRIAPFYIFIEKVIGPLRNAITKITGWLSRWMFFFLKTEKEVSIEELKLALSTSKKQEVLGAEEAKLVRGFLNLEEDRVKEVMRPRSEMLSYDLSQPLNDLISIFVQKEITRVPITENDPENVIGILDAGVFFLHREEITSSNEIKPFLEKPFFVPETMTGKLLLKQMYERKTALAIVVDEYGATAGLITSEDLVELVFGQIIDRRDSGAHFSKAGEDIIIASGKLELIEFEEIFDIHLDSHHNMATIGGWLSEQIEDIPKTGDKITLNDFLFHILDADQTHVKRLYIRKLKKKAETKVMWTFYLMLVIIALIVQSFYSMMEMACVSFNKVRLHYYANKGYKRAKWLSFLLAHPGRLFGTTLISVNTALQFGSESARQFYSSLGLSPDWAPLTQVFIVLIFAELSPMFAARKHAEQVAMLGAFFLYLTSKILFPIIWLTDAFCKLLNKLFGAHISSALFLTRDELQKAIESREEDVAPSQIFALKSMTARELVEPLEMVEMASSNASVKDLRNQLKKTYIDHLPVYKQTLRNIVGIIYPRDLINTSDQDLLETSMRSAWFISEKTSIMDLLSQFRTNNQTLAIVLDLSGLAIGILTLDAIIDTIFGSFDSAFNGQELGHIFIERTFSGDTSIDEINDMLKIQLPTDRGSTLNDLILATLDHPPARGETVRINHFELSVQETSLLGAKTVLIRTVS